MKYIETTYGAKASQIGFCCSKIGGSIGSQEARKNLQLALDFGINHFDVARSYGYGTAENFLGRFLSGKRHDVILESKFGIVANRQAQLIKPALPILRMMKQVLSKNKSDSQTTAEIRSSKYLNRFQSRIVLNEFHFKKSIETSLKALKTDYIDCYYLHEPFEVIDNIDALMAASIKLKEEGKIRAFGLAYETEFKNVHQTYLNGFDVLQFNINTQSNSYGIEKQDRGLKRNVFLPSSLNILNIEQLLAEIEKMSLDFPQSTFLFTSLNTPLLESIEKILKKNS